ncbi:putative hydrolase of the HAD superfamily [Pacificibacter maritimus]|uniref:Putative hydrolase of the HAD superfamily n=1 Tax=Pacificibacter maritimus TaxID=762213 RepID=A0A3N4VDG3_9RHOB|nr:pyrimidine 5'-nucleotidase [Pacificibacter maritimus]RPE71900.1 putative hydrolase of the HAD superfamily [Pacificibacter maritimus]
MVQKQFSHVRGWIFDLDNTLYPPETSLFPQIEVRMTDWVAKELGVTPDHASRLRTQYWRDFGTTLSGMMHLHDTDPLPYLTYVHDIDFTVLSPDLSLRSAIDQLHGRKIVYTNGSAPYAEKVLQARGLSGLFDAVYGIEHAGFHPKPNAQAYAQILQLDGMHAPEAAMFEDDPRNLKVPHDLGMKTVHVAPEKDMHIAPFIQHHTADLTAFLRKILGHPPETA